MLPSPYQIDRVNTVAVFRITRPQRANAFSRSVLLGLGRFVREMGEDDEVRGLVVSGAGDRHFCAGADLEERAGWTEDEVREQLTLYRSELGALDRCSKPVIAAINGHALGGGLEIAMACDLRVASSHAVFGQPETSLGIIPGAGGTQRLTRLVGEARAKELILLALRIGASQALAWGLINRIAPAGIDVVSDTMAWIEPILQGAPLAQGAALTAIDAACEVGGDRGMDVEREAYESLLGTEDRREGLRAFAEKRRPKYIGR